MNEGKGNVCTLVASKDASSLQGSEQRIEMRINEMIMPNSARPVRHIREDVKLNEEEAFVERISSFTGWNWSVKACQVLPPRCASYGWRVVDKDLMQCCTCQKFLSAQLPPVWNPTYDEAVTKLKESVRGSHATFCPWPLYPSPVNFLTNKLLQTETTIQEFGDQLTALNAVGMLLPKISPDIPEALKMDEMEITRISDLVHIPNGVRLEALTIALCGWKLMEGSISLRRICCAYCLRKTELSLYTPTDPSLDNGGGDHGDNVVSPSKSVTQTVSEENAGGEQLTKEVEQPKDESESPTVKKPRKWELRSFHPLEEHRLWCPWVAGNSGDPVSSPGWQRLLGVLRLRIKSPQSRVDKDKLVTLRKRILAMKRIVKELTVDPKTRKSKSAS